MKRHARENGKDKFSSNTPNIAIQYSTRYPLGRKALRHSLFSAGQRTQVSGSL